MKRNITVNLFGSLYPIDEDAYSLLDSYLTNMRTYFMRQPDGKEIADDIEARVAELMSDLRAQGVNAISIAHVEEIISRVGKPEELDSELAAEFASGEDEKSPRQPEDPSYATPDTFVKGRKLFRDTSNALLGGVLAGFGVFTGVSVTALRLIMAATVLILLPIPHYAYFLIPCVAYIVCWALIPAAKTPAERLEMKGEPVNLETLREEFLSAARKAASADVTGGYPSRFARFCLTVFRGALAIAAIIFLLLCAAGLLMAIAAAIAFAVLPLEELTSILGETNPLALLVKEIPHMQQWIFLSSLIITLGLTLAICIHLLLRLSGKVNPLSRTTMWGAIILWFLSAGTLLGSFASMVVYGEKIHKEAYRESRQLRDEALKAKVTDAGWTIVKDRNLNGHYTRSGEHYSGWDHRTYIDGGNKDGNFEYEVTQTRKVAPGIYTLSAAARTDGHGCEIFAINGKGQRFASPVPVSEATGGDIWLRSRMLIEADTIGNLPDREMHRNRAEANNGRGFGWNLVKVSPITVGPDSLITYGVTNQSPTTPWDGVWFSATTFTLTKGTEAPMP